MRTRWLKSIENNLRFCKHKDIFHSPCKLNSLFRYNDSLKKNIHYEIVYRYASSNSNMTYYGKTYRHFCTRAEEHVVISNITGKHLKSVKQLAVSNHLLEYNCSIDFDDFDILASDACKVRLLTNESLLTKRDQPRSNKSIMPFPLKLIDWSIYW